MVWAPAGLLSSGGDVLSGGADSGGWLRDEEVSGVGLGFNATANPFSHLSQRHFAFMFPAGSIVWELEAAKAPFS